MNNISMSNNQYTPPIHRNEFDLPSNLFQIHITEPVVNYNLLYENDIKQNWIDGIQSWLSLILFTLIVGIIIFFGIFFPLKCGEIIPKRDLMISECNQDYDCLDKISYTYDLCVNFSIIFPTIIFICIICESVCIFCESYVDYRNIKKKYAIIII